MTIFLAENTQRKNNLPNLYGLALNCAFKLLWNKSCLQFFKILWTFCHLFLFIRHCLDESHLFLGNWSGTINYTLHLETSVITAWSTTEYCIEFLENFFQCKIRKVANVNLNVNVWYAMVWYTHTIIYFVCQPFN